MAKKGAVQLQVEINNDEEWEKLLQRDGLIVIDVYSEWCGPCFAMQALLRKIKLEQGGDFLHLAMAKSDNITDLQRFRDKSEPTWMFIAQGKQVCLLFGASAPILQKTILDEMKKEKDCLEGKKPRPQILPNDLSEEEQMQFNKKALKEAEEENITKKKALKLLTDRRTTQAKNILDTMAHVGLILSFPHCTRKIPAVIEEIIQEFGLQISKRERPALTEEALEDIEFFSPYKIPDSSHSALFGEKSYAMMITQEEGTPTPIDETVLSFIYGPSKAPPGDKGSPADILMKRVEVEEKEAEETEEVKMGKPSTVVFADEVEETEAPRKRTFKKSSSTNVVGVWAPANDLVKATALKYFFPLITAPLIIPEPPPIPPHVAVAFDAIKRQEVLKLIDEFKDDVMAYGFFTDENPEKTEFIAKTKRGFEKKFKQPGNRLVVKLSRKRSEPLLAFAQLGPCYMSPNPKKGEKECSRFFPEGYELIESEEEDIPEVKSAPAPEPETDTVVEIVFEEGVIEAPTEEHVETKPAEELQMTELPGVEGPVAAPEGAVEAAPEGAVEGAPEGAVVDAPPTNEGGEAATTEAPPAQESNEAPPAEAAPDESPA